MKAMQGKIKAEEAANKWFTVLIPFFQPWNNMSVNVTHTLH